MQSRKEKFYFILRITHHHQRTSRQKLKAGSWRKELIQKAWRMLHIPYWLEPYSFLCVPRSLTLHLACLWNTFLLGKKKTNPLNNQKIKVLRNSLCILKTKRINSTTERKSTNILLKGMGLMFTVLRWIIFSFITMKLLNKRVSRQ